ncbi:CYFA0S07e04324g1_1 [Cyberlindnera fabianii]|uniref:CYFA0S07e04324g1_1 n=1 Tax=Cyberlindnera fabianii TaxID=36022 RepID=A0A061AWP2_CYBFA|nr:CYFA0S07e04324g1_1 [Cyberlindnera fabianii]
MSLLATSNFDPSGQYYASAITALDTHKIRVQSTTSTSVLANAFSLDKGSKLTCLSWGASPSTTATKSSKKRRLSNFNIENQLIAVGLNKGSILLYAPLANEVIAKLDNPNASSITDFHFSTLTNSGWSTDVSNNVIEWDLILHKPKTQFKFTENVTSIRTIEYEGKPHLLLASHSISIVDISTKEIVKTFPGHISPIHTVLYINSTTFLTAAQGDRFINIYSLTDSSHVLVTQSNVLSVAVDNETVTALTEDGVVELFQDVLAKVVSKRKGNQSKKANSTILLQRPDATQIKIEDSSISKGLVTITWLESGSVPYFERVKIEDITSEKFIVIKDKPAITAKDHSLFGQDVAAAKRYNESNTMITSGDNLRFLDNTEDVIDEEDVEDGPSFGERFEALKVEQNAVTATTAAAPKKKTGKATTGSLAVVLTQALRSNDHSLLETVLANRDEKVTKATVERLDTSLAVTLLERLAERIARQTNRQGSLNVWVKWVMVVHGGYLINVPNLSKSLASLHSTLARRATTLPRLLELQGKLDVLYSQQELNRVTKSQVDDDYDDDADDLDSDVEYVEELEDEGLIDNGEEDYDMDGEDDGHMSIDESEDDDDDDDRVPQENFSDDGQFDQEEGYSDEEINGKLEESEEEDDQAELKARIEKLKAKQQKRKGRK